MVLTMLKKQMISRFATTNTGDISLIHGMLITRDRENETLILYQEDYTRSELETYGIGE